MMFPLHFHYEDILRQDLLLKLNYANVMEVPGSFEIRLVPKASKKNVRPSQYRGKTTLYLSNEKPIRGIFKCHVWASFLC